MKGNYLTIYYKIFSISSGKSSLTSGIIGTNIMPKGAGSITDAIIRVFGTDKTKILIKSNEGESQVMKQIYL